MRFYEGVNANKCLIAKVDANKLAFIMPVRKIKKSYCTVTGLIASEKSNNLIAYETRPQRYFVKQVSFNPNVKNCEEQPVNISYEMKNGKKSNYIPDFLIHFADNLSPSKYWKPLLVEVTSRRTLSKNWNTFHRKFLAARRFAYDHNWEFTIISERELINPYLNNVVFLTRYRNYPINKEDEKLVLNILDKPILHTPESILQSLTYDRYETMRLIPVIWKLVSLFQINADLEIPLNMQSPLKKNTLIMEENDERFYSLCAGRIGNARWRALRYHPLIRA